MNIFVLHAMGDFTTARKTSVDHVLCFERYCPEHNYYYHDIGERVPDVVRDFAFDGAILDPTALCARYSRPRELFHDVKERYAFLASWDAIKVAFPQDDYDHGAILDRWLDDYGVDVVYSVVWEHRELIYSRMLQRGALQSALTGYVDDADVEGMAKYARPLDERTVDVGYRARSLPAQFGRFGQIKARIAGHARRKLADSGLVLDISTAPEAVFFGADWLRFLGGCRFCLGCEGGSSLLDPEGLIADRVREYAEEHAEATYEEIEKACFPGQDRKRPLSAVSPRLFEAALVGCGQILVEAPYLGVLKPFEHYLPIGAEGEGLEDLAPLIRDDRLAKRLVEACRSALIDTDDFRYSAHARRVVAEIEDRAAAKKLKTAGGPAFQRMRARVEMRERRMRRRVERRVSRWRRSTIPGLVPAWVKQRIPSRLKARIRRHLFRD